MSTSVTFLSPRCLRCLVVSSHHAAPPPTWPALPSLKTQFSLSTVEVLLFSPSPTFPTFHRLFSVLVPRPFLLAVSTVGRLPSPVPSLPPLFPIHSTSCVPPLRISHALLFPTSSPSSLSSFSFSSYSLTSLPLQSPLSRIYSPLLIQPFPLSGILSLLSPMSSASLTSHLVSLVAVCLPSSLSLPFPSFLPLSCFPPVARERPLTSGPYVTYSVAMMVLEVVTLRDWPDSRVLQPPSPTPCLLPSFLPSPSLFLHVLVLLLSSARLPSLFASPSVLLNSLPLNFLFFLIASLQSSSSTP